MKALLSEFGGVLQHNSMFNVMVRGYSPHLITFLVSEMRRHGVALEAALEGSDITPATLASTASRYSVLQILRVVMNSLRLTPEIAFDVGARLEVVACGIYGYAMLSSPDRQQLIGVVRQYAHLVDPLTRVTYSRLPGYSVWQVYPLLPADPEHPLYRFATELKLASSLAIGKDLYGPQFRFHKVRLRYAAPPQTVAYARHLQCQVEFSQEVNQIILSEADTVLQGVSRPDPMTHALALQLCESEAQRLAPTDSFSSAVAALLRERPDAMHNIDQAAAQLALHPRTLRRRLKTEGTSFSDIVNAQRLELALLYLRQSELSNEDIALRLGYSDAANFRKAFVAWTGDTPSRFRLRHSGQSQM